MQCSAYVFAPYLQVLTMGFTYSADQCLARTKQPLAFAKYINNKFNR